MKKNLFNIIFILEIYIIRGITLQKSDVNINQENKEEDKIKYITNKVNEIINLDYQIKDLIIETNSTLNKINKKSKNINEQLLNLKLIEGNDSNYFKNFIFCFFLIIFLASLIYIIEIVIEKQKKKNKGKFSINSISSNNNNINNKQGKDTKIYFSI